MFRNLLGPQAEMPLGAVSGLNEETSTNIPVHAGAFAGSLDSKDSGSGGLQAASGYTGEQDFGEEFPSPMKSLAERVCKEVLLAYGQVVDEFLDGIERTKGKAARWTYSGPLNKFIAFHKIERDTLIVEVTEEIFDRRLNEYLASMNGAPSTRYNHKACLSEWWHSHIKPRITRPAGDGLPDTLGAAILKALEAKGMSQATLAREIGMPRCQLNSYLVRGVMPRRAGLNRIEAMERVLGLSPGTLASRCPHIEAVDSAPSEKVASHSEALGIKCQNRYRLRFKQWPARVREEWSHFEQVATGKLIPFQGFKAGNFWTVDNRGHSATAAMARQFFEAFLGFCRVAEIPETNLTLALIKNCGLVSKFFEFFRLRQGLTFIVDKATLLSPTDNLPGHHTPTSKDWVRMIISLLKPVSGYLWQIHTYAQALGTSTEASVYLPRLDLTNFTDIESFKPCGSDDYVSPNLSPEVLRWREGCQETHDTLKSWVRGKVKRNEIRATRIVAANVEKITSRDRPLDAIIDAANKMERSLPPEPDPSKLSDAEYAAAKETRAIKFQDMLIMRLNTAVPLRPRNNREMTFKGPFPNLFQHKGEIAWRLQFKEWETKNYRERSLILPESLWPYIEEFLDVHRPYLLGPHTDYVFRPTNHWRRGKRPDADAPISTSCFRERFLKATSKAFGYPGFTVYGMRHICVTAWLKEDPNAILVAASILDDTVQTVIDSYAQLRKEELYSHYGGHYERSFERATTGAVAHEPLESIPTKYLETLITALENANGRGQSMKDVTGAMKAVLRRVRARS